MGTAFSKCCQADDAAQSFLANNPGTLPVSKTISSREQREASSDTRNDHNTSAEQNFIITMLKQRNEAQGTAGDSGSPSNKVTAWNDANRRGIPPAPSINVEPQKEPASPTATDDTTNSFVSFPTSSAKDTPLPKRTDTPFLERTAQSSDGAGIVLVKCVDQSPALSPLGALPRSTPSKASSEQQKQTFTAADASATTSPSKSPLPNTFEHVAVLRPASSTTPEARTQSFLASSEATTATTAATTATTTTTTTLTSSSSSFTTTEDRDAHSTAGQQAAGGGSAEHKLDQSEPAAEVDGTSASVSSAATASVSSTTTTTTTSAVDASSAESSAHSAEHSSAPSPDAVISCDSVPVVTASTNTFSSPPASAKKRSKSTKQEFEQTLSAEQNTLDVFVAQPSSLSSSASVESTPKTKSNRTKKAVTASPAAPAAIEPTPKDEAAVESVLVLRIGSADPVMEESTRATSDTPTAASEDVPATPANEDNNSEPPTPEPQKATTPSPAKTEESKKSKGKTPRGNKKKKGGA